MKTRLSLLLVLLAAGCNSTPVYYKVGVQRRLDVIEYHMRTNGYTIARAYQVPHGADYPRADR